MSEEQKAAQLIFDGARGVEGELRLIYGQWFTSKEQPFDDFVKPVFRADGGVDESESERLEEIAREVDLHVIEQQGDEYPLAVMKTAYASARLAMEYAETGRTLNGWLELNNAYYWSGQLNGREWGSWEQDLHQRNQTSSRLLDAKYREKRAERAVAMKWYDDHRHEYRNDDDRADAIIEKKIVVRAFSTVRGWISEHRSTKK